LVAHADTRIPAMKTPMTLECVPGFYLVRPAMSDRVLQFVKLVAEGDTNKQISITLDRLIGS
jgi:hypothetical protein